MNDVACTLFEGSYHYGVAGLANSLHAVGFRGAIYAGYRGELPGWASLARPLVVTGWSGARALPVADDVEIIFLPLDTTHHLTNYKADFMLKLADGPACGASSLVYFDPDICVTSPWSFVRDWLQCGVALCEDVNSPLPRNHPRRVGWRSYYRERGLALEFRAAEYVNGGFVGLRLEHRRFLELWKRTMDLMSEAIGSLASAKIAGGQAYQSTGFANCFDCSDQDALNAACEAYDGPVSVVGQEAMAFKHGPDLMPHALGVGKPWQRRYLLSALRGMPPRRADAAFWACVAGPIRPFGRATIALRRLDLRAASAVARVLRRS